MLLKIQKYLCHLFLVSALLPLGGCLPDISLLQEQPPQTTEVTNMGTSAHKDSLALYCKAGHGTALFGHDWYDFEDTPFTLYQGESATINITRAHGREDMMIQALYDGAGQKMIFCPIVDAPPEQRIPCASLYVLEDDLRVGVKRTLDIPNAVRGGAVTCAYKITDLKSLATPTSGGN